MTSAKIDTASSASDNRNFTLEEALADSEARFEVANPRSQSRQELAERYFPGGNTRSVIFYPPFPVTIVRGDGCFVWDLDGHKYVDLQGEFTAGLYGHSNPKIIAAVREALDSGIVLGGPNTYEADLAKRICDLFPSCDRVRFCNSGTEANLMALGTARIFTKREKIMVFKGGYHGGVLMYGAGGAAINVPFQTVVAPYNDIEGTRNAFKREAGNIAAILVEPMIGSGGAIPAEPGFLEMLRDLSWDSGALLIFDEVMTSRLSVNGLQGKLGITPDLTTFGKYLGGGLTFGGFGGRTDVMDAFNSRKPTYVVHAGTFNNNVLTMAAGLAALTKVYSPKLIDELNDRGDRLRAELNEAAEQMGVAARVTGMGSIMNVHFQNEPVRQPDDIHKTPPQARSLFHLEMLARGFFVARRGLVALSISVSDAEVREFREAFKDFLDEYRSVLPAV